MDELIICGQLDNVKKVISHEQALAQCSEKIQKLDFDILIGADTAGSAKMISENNILVCSCPCPR